MSSAVTQWFSCATPPVHHGLYEFRLKPELLPFGFRELILPTYFNDGIYFLKWDRDKLTDETLLNTKPNDYEWRGLADKPEGAKA